MSDVQKPFLPEYSGQTVDELIALEHTHRVDSLVLAFESALDQKSARKGEDSLSIEEQTILAIEGLEREVNNGGFHQYFVNHSVQYAPIIVDSLLRIGCPQTAAIAQDAIAALRIPFVSVSEIESVIYDDDDVRDTALGKCDRRFFDYPDPIAERLFEFIKANRDKINF